MKQIESLYLVKIFDKRIMMPTIYLGHTREIIQGTQKDTLNKDHKEHQGTDVILLTKRYNIPAFNDRL